MTAVREHLNVLVSNGPYETEVRSLTHAPVPPEVVAMLTDQGVTNLEEAHPELDPDDHIVRTYTTTCYGVCATEDNDLVYRHAR